MTQQIQFDAERWMRTNAELYERKGNQQMARNIRACADELHRLRMGDELAQQGEEYLRVENVDLRARLYALTAELAALKDAARPVVKSYLVARHEEVLSGRKVNPDRELLPGVTVAQLDALAALVGEETI